MSPPPPGEQDYGLSNAWELARQRLALLETCHDAATFRRAEALGVGPGWHCLEAGAGGGSVARWLAQRVGESGSVLAVDIDVTVLREIEAPGVQVRQMDLTTDALPEAAFDLVHTRLVLLHIPGRDEVLRRLAASLRPGGVMLLEEDDIFPVRAVAGGAYRAAWDAFQSIMDAGGTDPEWARDLPGRLGDLGLTGVDADVDAQLFRGGSDLARFWSLTFLQGRERAVAAGAPGEVIDAGRAELEDPARWFHGPATIVAWGRRPDG